MTWRKFLETDYPMLCLWFKDHGWEITPPLDALSSSGIVVEENGEPLAAGFLYMTNSTMGFFEWIVTKPKQGTKAFKALKFLCATAQKCATDIGITRLMLLSHDKTRSIFKKCGFVETEPATIMVWGVS